MTEIISNAQGRLFRTFDSCFKILWRPLASESVKDDVSVLLAILEGREEMPDEIPVACCLTDEELHHRERTLLAQFKAGVIDSTEVNNGYVFRVPGDKKWITLVAELIVAERECCPFLKFELSLEPGMGPGTLRITGPDGTKEFLKSIFV